MSQAETKTREETKLAFPKRYNVVIDNDDYTPVDFVIALLIEIFNHQMEAAHEITMKIHNEGKGIAGTYNREVADQKVLEAKTMINHSQHPLNIRVETV